AVLARIDPLGLVSLPLASLTLALWMIPVALDSTLSDPAYAALKYTSLLATGLMLRGAAARAPMPIQAFFVGGIGWMAATAGLIYQDTPRALCLYYLVDMQQHAGMGLVLFAIVGGGWWCLVAAGVLSRPRNVPTPA